MKFFSTIFGEKKPAAPVPSAAVEADKTEQTPAPGEPASFELAASVETDVGCVREANEDNATFTRPQDPEVLAEKGALLLVADGLGGCSGGEIASGMAIETIPRSYYASKQEPHEALRDALEKVNQEIFDAGADNPTLAGMGTTGVALAICGMRAYAAWVGDSRLYLIRAGRIYQMTQDHSMVFDLVQKGLLTPEEARNHEDRNVLLRSLGGREKVEVSVWEEPMSIREDDRFLLCSDGLHDLVEDPEILKEVLAVDEKPATLRLIEMAKQRGGYDNVTVALLHVKGAGVRGNRDAKSTREILVAT